MLVIFLALVGRRIVECPLLGNEAFCISDEVIIFDGYLCSLVNMQNDWSQMMFECTFQNFTQHDKSAIVTGDARTKIAMIEQQSIFHRDVDFVNSLCL